MVDRTLSDFVRDALAKGAARGEIEAALAGAGWPADQVRAALAAYADDGFVVPVPVRRSYVSAREAFLYLVLFIVLGILAIHLGVLLFALVDAFLPPAVVAPYAARALSDAIRWAVSALAVALPVFLVLSWRLGRARRRNPAMQDSRIRKWLTYIALVFAASTLIGDLIAVIYNFLSGELTLRFLLKALVIGAIAGGIFVHYVRDAEAGDERAGPALLDRLLAGGLAVAVAAASVIGIAIIDSPAALRGRERDEARLDSIARIAGAVDCYWTYEAALPESLAAMETALDARASETGVAYGCDWSAQEDPATGAPFDYRPLDAAEYEVCAVFDRATDENDRGRARTYSYGPAYRSRTLNAVHGAGRHCYALTAENVSPGGEF